MVSVRSSDNRNCEEVPNGLVENSDWWKIRLPARVAHCFGLAAGAAILSGVTMTIIAPQPVHATPAFTEQTHLPCTQCHTSPSNGANLTKFGKEFQTNGHKLPKR